MKRQFNSSIKAHFVRRAALSLLLVAVCAIPFALAQQNTSRRVATKGQAKISQNTARVHGGFTNVFGTRSFRPVGPGAPGGSCPPVITESTNQEIVEGGSVACGPGFETHYWRAFDMNTFTGGQQYDITSVEFGIELASSLSGTGQPVTVNLYTNDGAPFPGGTRTLLATSGPINVPDQSFTILNVPITATVPAGTLDLVMEVIVSTNGDVFLIGANPDPETRTSYISSDPCGTPDPVPVADIGFPDVHYVINVNGSCPSGSPTPTPTATVTATPRLTPSPRPRPTPVPRPGQPSATPSPSATATTTPSATATATPSATATTTPSATATATPSATATATPSATASSTATPTARARRPR